MRPSRALDNPPVLIICSLRLVSSGLDAAVLVFPVSSRRNGFPEPRLGADRAVALAGALGQIELAFEAHRAPAAAAVIGLFHSFSPRCSSGIGASRNSPIIATSQSARSKTAKPGGTKCVVP